MSGGSHDYLYVWAGDAEILMEKRHHLREMAKDLKQDFPGTEAARDTDELNRLINHFQEEVNRRSAPLSNVWKCFEWYCSGDSARGAAEAAVDEYAAAKLAARS